MSNRVGSAERPEPLGFRLIATYPVNLVHVPLYAALMRCISRRRASPPHEREHSSNRGAPIRAAAARAAPASPYEGLDGDDGREPAATGAHPREGLRLRRYERRVPAPNRDRRRFRARVLCAGGCVVGRRRRISRRRRQFRLAELRACGAARRRIEIHLFEPIPRWCNGSNAAPHAIRRCIAK